MKVLCNDGRERDFVWKKYAGFFCLECNEFPDGFCKNIDNIKNHVCAEEIITESGS